MLAVASCQTSRTTPAIGIDRKAVCATLYVEITYSGKNDTPETIENVRRHNARRDAWCEGKR